MCELLRQKGNVNSLEADWHLSLVLARHAVPILPQRMHASSKSNVSGGAGREKGPVYFTGCVYLFMVENNMAEKRSQVCMSRPSFQLLLPRGV